MALPELPTQGQSPWFTTRNNWDLAVKSELEGRLSESELSATITWGEIKKLAIEDGWTALYDATNPYALSESGIADSLGNLPPLVADTAWTVTPNKFGRISGVKGVFTANLTSPIEPIFMMAVGQFVAPTESYSALLGGVGYSIGVIGNIPRHGTGRVNVSDPTSGISAGAHIFEGTNAENVPGDRSILRVDGQLQTRRFLNSSVQPVSKITVGATSPGSSEWEGFIGPVLVREDSDYGAITRMRDLISMLTGISIARPNFVPEVKVFTADREGQELVANGDPDAISLKPIASITKLLNALVARDYLGDGDLDTKVTVTSDDIWTVQTRLAAGDIVSYRDLFYLMLLPSDDHAPRTLARVVGGLIPGAGTGYDKFRAKMNEKQADLGMVGATVYQVGGGARMSPRQVTQLLWACYADPFIRTVSGTMSRSVTITGPNARTYTVDHTVDSITAYKYDEMVMGKTGTSGGVQNLASIWEHEGKLYTTVVLNVSEDISEHSRYAETFKANESAKSGHKFNLTGSEFAGSTSLFFTGPQDITHLFPGWTKESSTSSGVFIYKTGAMVTLDFYRVTPASSATFQYNSIIADGYRPTKDMMFTVSTALGTGSAVIRVSRLGTVSKSGTDSVPGEYSGSFTFPAASSGLEYPPMMGLPWHT